MILLMFLVVIYVVMELPIAGVPKNQQGSKFNSFKVTVNIANVEEMMEPSTWQYRVCVRRWRANKHTVINMEMNNKLKLITLKIGKDSNNSKRILTFNINNIIVTDSEVIANEFNNLFVSIGPTIASNITCSKDPLTYVNGIANSIVVLNLICMDVRTVISSLKIVAQDLMVSLLL